MYKKRRKNSIFFVPLAEKEGGGLELRGYVPKKRVFFLRPPLVEIMKFTAKDRNKKILRNNAKNAINSLHQKKIFLLKIISSIFTHGENQ